MDSRGTRTLVDFEDNHNKGWFDQFVVVPTRELIRPEYELISENDKCEDTSSLLAHSFLSFSF